MNKKRVFILSLIVVVLAGVFLLLKHEKTEPANFLMTEAEQKVWQEYNSQTYGLSFSYPANELKVEENETFITLNKLDGEVVVTISGSDMCDVTQYSKLEKVMLGHNVYWKFSQPFYSSPGYVIAHTDTGLCQVISMPGSIPEKTYSKEEIKLLDDVVSSIIFTVTPQAINTITKNAEQATSTSIANPASTNCAKQGGELRIQTKEDGSQYGLCYFDDARACEEWAMMRGDCPVGGMKTTGYDTLAQKYCAWLGGRTTTVADSVCTFKDGSTCLDADLYLGVCQKGDWPKK